MDIAGLSTAMHTADLQMKVSTAMLSKAMDMSETLGDGLVDIIDAAALENSVNPNLGSNVDVRI